MPATTAQVRSSLAADLPPEAERQRAYEDVLISRFENGLPLTRSDKRDARRLIAKRKES